jgi:ABC-type glycerol-3-phosphate transport system substrate-binding protein
MRLKKLLALGMVATMGLSLVACGSSDSGSSSDSSSSDSSDSSVPAYTDIELGTDYTDLTATIKFLHHKTDREEDGTMAEMIAAFNEVYPNITVETEGVTDYAEDSLLRLTTGDWGDVMFIPAVDKKDLSTYFYPIDTLENLDTVINFANQWEYDGESYGIPYMANAQGVLYNKAVFEEAGITELPTTPDEFIADLQLIKDNTDAIPLYTNYAAEWTMGAWDAYLGCVSNGDDTYFNQKFVHDANPFADNGDGTGAYALYKILYDACANKLIEEDYTTTDWEGCKSMLNNGEIGTMVLGSWAYAQMVEAGDHGDDVGYMPFPITVDGTQYALAAGDYCYGINVNSSDENKTASMIFIKWMTEESNWCYNEGGYTVVKGGQNPDMYSAFENCTLLSDEPALSGEEDYLNEMNSESELSFNAGGNAKVMSIVEAGATGSKTFDEIMAEWTEKWNAAQESCGIEAE